MDIINQVGDAPRSITLNKFREAVKGLGYVATVSTTEYGRFVEYKKTNGLTLKPWNSKDFTPLLEYLSNSRELLIAMSKAYGISVYSVVGYGSLSTKRAE